MPCIKQNIKSGKYQLIIPGKLYTQTKMRRFRESYSFEDSTYI